MKMYYDSISIKFLNYVISTLKDYVNSNYRDGLTKSSDIYLHIVEARIHLKEVKRLLEEK